MKERDKPLQLHNIAGIPPTNTPLSKHERAVITAHRDVAYGAIEMQVHNTRIVQITRSQKFIFSDQ